MRSLLIFLQLLVHIVSSIVSNVVRSSGCEFKHEVSLIKCAFALVEPVELEQLGFFHPPLSQLTTMCNRFSVYNICISEIPIECRHSTTAQLERTYGAICEDPFRESVISQRHCFKTLESDDSLKRCVANRSALSTEQFTLLGGNSSLTDRVCAKMQSYIDCAFTDGYVVRCAEAVQLEMALFDQLLNTTNDDCYLQWPQLYLQKSEGEAECDMAHNCTCTPGFAYNETLAKCADINECKLGNHNCSQVCINTYGSYICACELQYFQLSEDGRSCTPLNKEPLWLLFAHGQSIWNISENGTNVQLQRAGLQKVAMIDFDYAEKQLYYVDIGLNVIERINFDGTSLQRIQDFEVDGVEGIAVDWVARNLYSVRRTDVLVQTLDGRFRKTLYRDVFQLPRALIAQPLIGKLYASDWSSSAFIARLNMDGSGIQKIVTEGIVWPNALTVDLFAEKIFWADAFLDSIQSARLDGTDRRTVISDSRSVPHVFGLTVAGDNLYWTDWSYRGILRANKFTGSNFSIIAQTALLPYSIKAFHPSLQPEGGKACEKAGCSHLCLITPEGDARCECSQGFHLEADTRSCRSNCSQSQFMCDGSNPRCLNRMFLCDGIRQCNDQTDEMNCPPRICLREQFQCHDNSKCLPVSSICDGVNDCQDSSDEKYCTSHS